LGKIDIGSKRLVHLYSQAWVEWVLQTPVQVETELSGEFQFIARYSDSLLQLSGPQGRFLALTELQFQYKPNIPKRVMAYAALAREKYDMDVFVTVVYFMPPPEDVTLTNSYHQEFLGQVARQDFQLIKLWELDANNALATNNPILLPFVPLMRNGNTQQMVQTCAQRLRQQPEHADELETFLAVLASYVLDKDLLNQLVRWDMDIVYKSPILEEILSENYRRGYQQGSEAASKAVREEVRKDMLDTLQQLLTFRFGIATTHFDSRFQSLDLQALKPLHQAALQAQSLAEFENALNTIPSQVPQESQDT
jgi:predicted transposase YdaD